MSEDYELNSVDKVIVLLLRASGESPIPGRLHLQKEMYTLSRRDPLLAGDLGFDAHLLGPHSDVVETESEQLELCGLIALSSGAIRLTPAGRRISDKVARSSEPSIVREVEETKELLNDLDSDELLAFVYFGESLSVFESESAEYDRVSRNRVRLAIQLLRKEKVSVSKAAEIAGLSIDDLIDRFSKVPA